MSEPGWTVVERYDQKFFKDRHNQTWGALKVYYSSGENLYYAGVSTAVDPSGLRLSDPVRLRPGSKGRVLARTLFYHLANATYTMDIALAFFKGDTILSNEEGNNVFGVRKTIQNAPSSESQRHDLRYEVEGRAIRWYVGGTKLGETTLNDTPDSCRVVVGYGAGSSGFATAGVYEVVSEYYDPIAAVFGSVLNLFNSILPLMIAGVMIAGIGRGIAAGLRKPKKVEEKEKEEEEVKER